MDLMSERKMSLRMGPKNMYSTDQGMDPNQYFLQDKSGNYAYAYANKNSEKMEKGDQNSVQGHYAYIMSNGQKRRVDYIADNQGFHVIRDDAHNAGRFKRSVEPAGIVSIIPDDVEALVVSNVVNTPLLAIAHDVSVVSLDRVLVSLLHLLRVLVGIGVSIVAKLVLKEVLVRAHALVGAVHVPHHGRHPERRHLTLGHHVHARLHELLLLLLAHV